MRYIAVAAVALAGLLHLAIAPGHYSHAPGHGIFHVGIGVMEIVWALAFWRRQSQALGWAGATFAGGLIVLWAITRVLQAPFEEGPEPIDAAGLIIKGAELVGLAGLVMLGGGRHGMRWGEWLNRRRLALALTLALAVGWASFGVGLAAEQVAPAWLSGNGHGHDGEESGAPAAVAPGQEARVIVLRATDNGYDPPVIRLAAGEPVLVLLQNAGTDEHHLHVLGLSPRDLYWVPRAAADGEQVDIHNLHHEGKLPFHICNSKYGLCPIGIDVHLHANAGDYDAIGFTPTTPGTYRFHCPIPGHDERGLVGTLVVTKS